ncbi:MAG: SEC-C metal-binding domain-containing protein, partial [Psychrobacter celer]
LDPTVPMSVTQKQPCICGSGEKFKRCCGKL